MTDTKFKTIAENMQEGYSRNIATFLTWYASNTGTITSCMKRETVTKMLNEKLNQSENEKDHDTILDLLEQVSRYYH